MDARLSAAEDHSGSVTEHTGLQHSLKQRHMTMIALGGVIGAGLFVGSGVLIQSAGPAAILSFLITGVLVVLVMRMLGEMAVAMPAVGSFYEYARLAWGENAAAGELAGFLTGWMYWYFWVIVVALEAVAGATLVQFWLPDVPAWIISLVLIVLLTATNLFSVKSFGEFEFWFASIKVAAIVVFLFLGGLFVLGMWPSETPGLSNLVVHGGFAPNGIAPILTGAVAATGFYFGAEIVTIAAAECAEPNGVPVRAILFGTIFGYASVVMSYVSPDTVFAFLVNSYGTVAIFVYVLIAISQLRLRARLEREAPERLIVRMWAYPYLTYVAIFGMVGIVVAMAFIPEQRTPLALGIVSPAVLLVAYLMRLFWGKRPEIAPVRGWRDRYRQEGARALRVFGWKGGQRRLLPAQEAALVATLDAGFFPTTAAVIDHVARTFGASFSKAGMIKLLHRLGFAWRKPKGLPARVDAAAQEAFIAAYEALLNRLEPDELVYFADAVHPEYQSRPAHGWVRRGVRPAVRKGKGRRRVNLAGALETGDFRMVEDETITAETTVKLLERLERANSGKRRHVILDRAATHRASPVAAWLARPDCRTSLIFLPAYAPQPQRHRAPVAGHAPPRHPQHIPSRLPHLRRGGDALLQVHPAGKVA